MVQLEVYTMHNCVFCKRLKDHLKEENIEYKERNINDSEEALEKARAYSMSRFPTVIVYSEGSVVDVMVGFDTTKNSMKKYLESYNK